LSWTFETKNSPKLLRKEFVKSLTFSLGHALLIKGLSDDVKTRVHNVISQYPFLAVQLPTMAVGQLIIVGGSRFVMRIPRIGSILYAFGLPVVLPVVTNKVAEKIEGLRDQICEDMTTALLGTHKDRIWDMVEVGQGFTKVEEQR
jgi:hypothetical protein